MLRQRDIIADFLRYGWNRILEYQGSVYLSPDDVNCDLVRTFSPALLKHHGAPIVPGILALFEDSALGKKPAMSTLSFGLVAGAHSANFRSLQKPLVYTQDSAEQWISRVKAVVSQLPRTLEQLKSDISERREVDGFPVNRLVISPEYR